MTPFKQILVLAAHTDDGELGCGGTMARLAMEGSQIFYAAFSICEESVPEPFCKDILAHEVTQATRVLGVTEENLFVHRFPVRHFPARRQEILEILVQMKKDVAPDLVLVPAQDDRHQDHNVVTTEAIRAFRHTTTLGYEMPWLNMHFPTSTFVTLEKSHVDKKVLSIQQYKSQTHRNYVNEDFVRSLAKVRGTQASSLYAEAFEPIRWIIS